MTAGGIKRSKPGEAGTEGAEGNGAPMVLCCSAMFSNVLHKRAPKKKGKKGRRKRAVKQHRDEMDHSPSDPSERAAQEYYRLAPIEGGSWKQVNKDQWMAAHSRCAGWLEQMRKNPKESAEQHEFECRIRLDETTQRQFFFALFHMNSQAIESTRELTVTYDDVYTDASGCSWRIQYNQNKQVTTCMTKEQGMSWNSRFVVDRADGSRCFQKIKFSCQKETVVDPDTLPRFGEGALQARRICRRKQRKTFRPSKQLCYKVMLTVVQQYQERRSAELDFGCFANIPEQYEIEIEFAPQPHATDENCMTKLLYLIELLSERFLANRNVAPFPHYDEHFSFCHSPPSDCLFKKTNQHDHQMKTWEELFSDVDLTSVRWKASPYPGRDDCILLANCANTHFALYEVCAQLKRQHAPACLRIADAPETAVSFELFEV